MSLFCPLSSRNPFCIGGEGRGGASIRIFGVPHGRGYGMMCGQVSNAKTICLGGLL